MSSSELPQTSAAAPRVGEAHAESELVLFRHARPLPVKLTPRGKWGIAALLIGLVGGPASWWLGGGLGIGVFLPTWVAFLALSLMGDPPGDATAIEVDLRVVLDLDDAEVRLEEGPLTRQRIPLDEKARVIAKRRQRNVAYILRRDEDEIELTRHPKEDPAEARDLLETLKRYGVKVPALDDLGR